MNDPVFDRYVVSTLLPVIGDSNVNIRRIKEILEEDHGEDSEDDA